MTVSAWRVSLRVTTLRRGAGLLLIIEIAELLSVLVADDEADVAHLVDGPGRREAAGRHNGGSQLQGN